MKTRYFSFLLSFLYGSLVFAHGEDKLGPNGGMIRMPGAFHTELVQVSPEQFKIFLLDMNFENPTVHDSSVEVLLEKAKSEKKILCNPSENHFVCKLSHDWKLGKLKSLSVLAKRENQKGGFAVYELPFKSHSSTKHQH